MPSRALGACHGNGLRVPADGQADVGNGFHGGPSSLAPGNDRSWLEVILPFLSLSVMHRCIRVLMYASFMSAFFTFTTL